MKVKLGDITEVFLVEVIKFHFSHVESDLSVGQGHEERSSRQLTALEKDQVNLEIL